jgi:hypothetical protein
MVVISTRTWIHRCHQHKSIPYDRPLYPLSNLIRINILMACYCKIIVGILQYPKITAGSMVIEFASKK